MIRATINGTPVTWDGDLRLPDDAPEPVVQALDNALGMGHPAFSPHRGGPYTIADATDPIHVLDALKLIARWGHAVELETVEVPELESGPVEYPGGNDDRMK